MADTFKKELGLNKGKSNKSEPKGILKIYPEKSADLTIS